MKLNQHSSGFSWRDCLKIEDSLWVAMESTNRFAEWNERATKNNSPFCFFRGASVFIFILYIMSWLQVQTLQPSRADPSASKHGLIWDTMWAPGLQLDPSDLQYADNTFVLFLHLILWTAIGILSCKSYFYILNKICFSSKHRLTQILVIRRDSREKEL